MRFDNLGGDYIKRDTIKDGQYFKILVPEPTSKISKYKTKSGGDKTDYFWKVYTDGIEGNIQFNFTSIKMISERFGAETSDWLGKWVSSKLNYDMATRKNQLFFFPVDPKTSRELDIKFKQKHSSDNPGNTANEQNSSAVDVSKVQWDE